MYGGAGAAQNDTITGTFAFTGANGNAFTFTASAGNNTYSDLADAINGGNYRVKASWDSGTSSLLSTSTTLGAQAAVAPGTNTIQDVSNATGGSASVGSFSAGVGALSTDFVGGTETFHANGKSFTYTGDGSTTTLGDLATALTQSGLGVTADFGVTTAGELTITSNTDNNNAVTMTGTGLTNKGVAGTATTAAMAVDAGKTSAGSAGTPVQATVVTGGADGSQTGTNGTLLTIEALGTGSSTQGTAGAPASHATAVLELNQASQTNPTSIADGSDQITGQITLTNGLVSHTFVQGSGVDTANTFYTGGTSIADLTSKINGDNVLGLSAIAPGGGAGAIYLQAVTAGTDNGGISVPAAPAATLWRTWTIAAAPRVEWSGLLSPALRW